MGDEVVVNFDDAKRPHVFKRQDEKIASIQKAFKDARATAGSDKPKKSTAKKKSKKKRRK